MLSEEEKRLLRNYAYLPEHIVCYVEAISQSDPYLIGDYISYLTPYKLLIFIGYPLRNSKESTDLVARIEQALRKFRPHYVSLIAPYQLKQWGSCLEKASDKYYLLDLSKLNLNQKLRNTIKSASRRIHIIKDREFKEEHLLLIHDFIKFKGLNLTEPIKTIFKKIPFYLSSCPTAFLFNARDGSGRLIAFSVAESASQDYAFYMFNFISRNNYIPGASDLILYEIVKDAQEEGKHYLNLGLGVNEGITYFKKKWGGTPFLNYEYCLFQTEYLTNISFFLRCVFP